MNALQQMLIKGSELPEADSVNSEVVLTFNEGLVLIQRRIFKERMHLGIREVVGVSFVPIFLLNVSISFAFWLRAGIYPIKYLKLEIKKTLKNDFIQTHLLFDLYLG